MYTQLNQYHVILEAEPQFQLDPDKLNHLYIESNSSVGLSGAPASSSSGKGSTSAGSNRADGICVVHAVGEYSCSSAERAYVKHCDFCVVARGRTRRARPIEADDQQCCTAERFFAL